MNLMLSAEDQKVINRFEKYLYEKSTEPEFLVKIIELAGDYLNIRTISDYAKEYSLTYNGVKKTRNIVEIFNVKFVIDNN